MDELGPPAAGRYSRASSLAVLAAGKVGTATSLVTKPVMLRSVRAQAAAPWRQAGWPVR